MPENGNGRLLPTHAFGSTGLQVSSLCIGCAELGNMPETFAYEVGEERALETIRAIFNGPINFVDTAASYGDGESERRIGIVLKEIGGLPDGFVLSTKADRDLQTGDFSGDQMRHSVERSMRLLGIDSFQIMYLHDPEHTSFENAMSKGGAVETLVRMQEEGIIQNLGVAGGPIDMSIRYVETGVFNCVITHNRYTLLNRSANPLLDIAHERGLGVANAAPYGSGILAKGPDAYPRYAYQDANEELVEQTRKIEAVCKRYNVPLAAAALQFSLRDPRISTTIVGMSKLERIEQTVQLAQHPVPDEIWEELEGMALSHEDPEASRWK